jgi:HEPN domain-containing protein
VARTFTAADGLTVADLLHFGFDHTASAEALIIRNARHYDSAGYLAHLGIECLLKAWHLHEFGQYQGIHRLEPLWKGLRQHVGVRQLSKKDLKTLGALDSYAELRYPNLNNALEIGSDLRVIPYW